MLHNFFPALRGLAEKFPVPFFLLLHLSPEVLISERQHGVPDQVNEHGRFKGIVSVKP